LFVDDRPSFIVRRRSSIGKPGRLTLEHWLAKALRRNRVAGQEVAKAGRLGRKVFWFRPLSGLVALASGDVGLAGSGLQANSAPGSPSILRRWLGCLQLVGALARTILKTETRNGNTTGPNFRCLCFPSAL
jgi:hypothetical protein